MLKIVSSAIDTIECSIYVDLRDEIINELYDAKEEAKKLNKNIEFYLGDERLVMYPNGAGFYKYLLKSDKYEVSISTSSKFPTVAAKIKSITLHELGPERALEELYRAIEVLGDITEKKIKRIDLCADIQGWTPKEHDLKNFISRADNRSAYYDRKNFTGFVFKAKTMLVRIYDKTEEIKISNKSWFYEVWK